MDLAGLMSWIRFVFGGQGFPCLFHLVTGFYCPGCGGTRAVRLLLQGNIARSFQYHPFVPYVALVLGIEGVFFLWGTARKDLEGNCRNMKKRYRFWVAAGAGIVLVNWVVKNACLAAGVDLLPPV